MSAGCRKVGAKVDGCAPLFRRGVAAGPIVLRVLSSTSPPVLAPRPVWGPHCGQLGAQIDATRSRDRAHCSLRVAADATMHIYRRGENERAWRDHFYGGAHMGRGHVPAKQLQSIPSALIPRALLGFSLRSRVVEVQHFVASSTLAPSSVLPSDSHSGNERIAADLRATVA